MLDVIVWAEGTGDDYGKIVNGIVKKSPYYPELVGKKNVSITDFSRFPDILVDVGRVWSSAAGRYQLTSDTWQDFGRGDFSPRSQDTAAVRLMIKEGAVKPLLAGNVREAIFACGKRRWASFPKNENGESIGAKSGQKAKPLAELEAKYNEYKAKY